MSYCKPAVQANTKRYPKLGISALLVHNPMHSDTAAGRAADELMKQLSERQVQLTIAVSAADAVTILRSSPEIQCLILQWGLENNPEHTPARFVLDTARSLKDKMPIFLLAERGSIEQIPVDVMQKSDDFIWALEDTVSFISGRIFAAIERYRNTVLPPMFGALARFDRVHEYSWHTPGHTGGTAFLKSTVGQAYFHFFGEQLLRSDLSISVGELGSLLDHSGPIGESERYAARVFGSHWSMHVTNGTSTSNRVVVMGTVARNQIALCDRNCHKSIEHAMTMSGAIPVYLTPSRNQYGIIGPIFPEKLTKAAIERAIEHTPLTRSASDKHPVYAIVTNSTYDGLCYNAGRVEALLNDSVDCIHFDEAWYGYARFNPIYTDRFAMRGDPRDHTEDRPTVFATQSTHKLLAALSQASYIHVRHGRKPVSFSRFNEAFMMYASTSPQYAIIASNDVSTAMMDGSTGQSLTTEAIREAVAFRRMIARIHHDFMLNNDWFFNVWQPDAIIDPDSGKETAFYAVDETRLISDPSCWLLHPNAKWHGFGDVEKDYCMLDPIKVSIITPGITSDGQLAKFGIPAAILTAYLDHQGIIVEKTADFTILFLFSIGVTKGKWGTLVNALLDFKRDYDANTPLSAVLPKLVKDYPERYQSLGLRQLADEMFECMTELKMTEALSRGFSQLPTPEMLPVDAYEHVVKGTVERLTLKEAANRTAATGIVPYPPGIPLLMPGENLGAADGLFLTYLKALEAYDRRFPGFEHDIHGIESENGVYYLLCIQSGHCGCAQ